MKQVTVINSQYDLSSRVVIIREGIKREYKHVRGDSICRLGDIARKNNPTYYNKIIHGYSFTYKGK